MRYLQLARLNRKFSQDQVAKLADIDQQHLSMLERGVCLPTPDQAVRLSAALNIPVDILCDEVPVPAETETVAQ